MEAPLHKPYHLIIPMNLLEWLDQHIFGTVELYFKHKDKVIKITKDMVDKIFDFPGGTMPFVFSSDDPQVKSEVAELRIMYVDHRNKMPINKIEEVMLSDETEDGFIRSFAFYFISTILCPATYCFGNTKFLYSLRDVSAIPSLNFGQLSLDFMREESERYFEMIMKRPTVEEMNKPSHIGGCLPIWGIRDISQTPYAIVGPVNNAPVNPTEFVSIPHVEVSVSNVPEDIFENKPLDSKSTTINPVGLKCTAKVDFDDKVKPDPHLKQDIRVELSTHQQPTPPKVENNVELKEEENNAKRSFMMISSSSSKDRVRFYQGTPILIEDDSPTTPVVATKEDITTSQCDASVEIQMPFDISEQQDFSTINDAEAGISTGPNTIENKHRQKRAAKVQSREEAQNISRT